MAHDAAAPETASGQPPVPSVPTGAGRRALALVLAVAAAIGLFTIGRTTGRDSERDVMHAHHLQDVAESTQRWEEAYLTADPEGRATLHALSPADAPVGHIPPPDYGFLPSYFAPDEHRVVIVGRVVTGSRENWVRIAVGDDGRSSWCTLRQPTGDPDTEQCEGLTIVTP